MNEVPTMQAWRHMACAACQKPDMGEGDQVAPAKLTIICTSLCRPVVEKEVTAYIAWNPRSWTALVRPVMEGGAAFLSWLPRACPVLGRQAAEDEAHLSWLGRP